MKWRSNRTFLITALVFAGISFGTFMAVKDQGGLDFTLFRLERWARQTFHLEKSVTPAERRQAKSRAEAAMKRALAEFPALRIEERNVPPEENGYLKAYELAAGEGIRRLRDSGVLEKLSEESGDFDAAAVRLELEAHEDVARSIIEVAELERRSSIMMQDKSVLDFPSANLKAMSDYLQLMARVAAKDGEEKNALRYVSLAVNLTGHLRDIENPTLFSETVVILLDLGIRGTVFKYLMPELGSTLDLEAWRSALAPPDYSPSRLGVVLVGEWVEFGKVFSQVIFHESGSDGIPDPESFCQAYAGHFSELSFRLESMDSKEMVEIGLLDGSRIPKDLSREGKLLMETMEEGMEAWKMGFCQASGKIALYDAAFDLLIRERNGPDLSGLKETFVVNPLTESPFNFDPVTREILDESLSSGYDAEPLILPLLK